MPPRIVAVDASVPGQVAMELFDLTCGVHRIEFSTDLKTWREWLTFEPDQNGHARVVDRRRGFFPEGWYRAVRL